MRRLAEYGEGVSDLERRSLLMAALPPPPGSISLLLRQFRDGHEAVFAHLYQRLRPAILDLARQQLRGVPCRDVDEEDMAQRAFLDLYVGLKQDRFPE